MIRRSKDAQWWSEFACAATSSPLLLFPLLGMFAPPNRPQPFILYLLNALHPPMRGFGPNTVIPAPLGRKVCSTLPRQHNFAIPCRKSWKRRGFFTDAHHSVVDHRNSGWSFLSRARKLRNGLRKELIRIFWLD